MGHLHFSSLRSVSIVLSFLLLACGLVACGQLPEGEDVGAMSVADASDDADADPGCCPIGALGFCGGTPTGGWAGYGPCSVVHDLGANRIVMDAHGCPTLVHEGPCSCLCPDVGSGVTDAGPDAGAP